MKKFCNYIFFFEIRNVYFQNHKKEYKYLWLICGRILFYESVHLYILFKNMERVQFPASHLNGLKHMCQAFK